MNEGYKECAIRTDRWIDRRTYRRTCNTYEFTYTDAHMQFDRSSFMDLKPSLSYCCFVYVCLDVLLYLEHLLYSLGSFFQQIPLLVSYLVVCTQSWFEVETYSGEMQEKDEKSTIRWWCNVKDIAHQYYNKRHPWRLQSFFVSYHKSSI